VVLEGKRDFAQDSTGCVPARQFLGGIV